MGRIVPFEGSRSMAPATPLFFSAMGASCLGKKIAAVTKISDGEEYLLEPLKTAGISLFVQPGETHQYRVVFPTANVDERRVFWLRIGDPFSIGDIPPLETRLIHLSCVGVRRFHIDLMRALKARGFRLSVDMQSFLLQPEHETAPVAARFEDAPEKKDIVAMADFVKLDSVEAQIVTGADVLQDQADILEEWGSSETVLTCSEGALARSEGEDCFCEIYQQEHPGQNGSRRHPHGILPGTQARSFCRRLAPVRCGPHIDQAGIPRSLQGIRG